MDDGAWCREPHCDETYDNVYIPSGPSTPFPSVRNRRAGFLFCLAAASGFSTIGILAKLAYAAHVNVVTLLAGRFLLTSVLLWLIVVAMRQSIPSGRPLAAGLALGLIGFGIQVTLLFLSLQRIDAALSALLFYSYPAMVTRSEEHTSELQSRHYLVCRLLLEKK